MAQLPSSGAPVGALMPPGACKSLSTPPTQSVSLPVCKERCGQILRGHAAGAHTGGSLQEVTSEFLITPTQGPFSLCWLQACLRPTGLVYLSVLISVWSWPQLTHLVTAISSPLPHLAAFCLLSWPSPGDWPGPGAERGVKGTRPVQGFESQQCAVSQPYLVGVQGWSWPWLEQRSGQSQPTRDGFGAVWSWVAGDQPRVLAAVCLRKGRVLQGGLGIKVKSSAHPLQSPAGLQGRVSSTRTPTSHKLQN